MANRVLEVGRNRQWLAVGVQPCARFTAGKSATDHPAAGRDPEKPASCWAKKQESPEEPAVSCRETRARRVGQKWTIALFVASALSSACGAEAKADTKSEPEKTFTVRPIGQVRREDGRTLIVLDKKYQPGLLGLEQWSHVQVFWWFDKNDTPEKRAVLQVHPRGNPKNPLTGVFATRSPFRPNLIALSLCKIVSVKDNVVEVEKIDAFDGTPVLDLKPYTPGQDAADKVRVPDWAKGK